jgi:hypothetical protein
LAFLQTTSRTELKGSNRMLFSSNVQFELKTQYPTLLKILAMVDP